VYPWALMQNTVSPYLQEYLAALPNSCTVQQQRLKEIVLGNSESIFGQKFKFSAIRSYREYCDLVPVQTYEDLAPYIQSIAEGENRVLTSDPVVAFEMTGGSTGGAKLIPYTQAGLTAFQQAIFPWLADLLQHRPGIKKGRTYWAISPAMRHITKTAGGIPVGMPNDAAYFGDSVAAYLVQVLAVPTDFGLIYDLDEWRYLTALFFLAAEDLTLISVWSPTFLLQIIEEIKNHRDRLIDDISRGTGSLPPQPVRAKLLKLALSKSQPDTEQIWPHLDTISCWKDAAAQAFIPQLQTIFPQAWIQGKGLLATEGVVTFPLTDCSHPILAINSNFYEFIDDRNNPYLSHELNTGHSYKVALTTPSGLYRYDTGDRIIVRGWHQQTPLLEFVGRTGLVSDLCGEKLTEEFVLNQLKNMPGFAMLAPSLELKPHYALFLDEKDCDRATAISISQKLDRALRSNPQYQYARDVGQLGAITAYRVKNPLEKYLNYALKQGQRLGDIKPPALRGETGWEQKFEVF